MFLDWLFCFVSAISGEAVITYAAVRLLECTRPSVYWVVCFASCAVTGAANAFASADLQTAWTLVCLAIFVVTFVVFSALKPLRALLMTACIFVVMILAEFAVTLMVVVAFGVNPAASVTALAYQQPAAYALTLVLHAIMLALLYYGVFVLKERFAKSDSPANGYAMLFFVSQVAMLLVATSMVVRFAAVDDERAMLAGCAFAIVGVVAFAVFIVATRRQQEQELVDARIEATNEASRAILERSREMDLESQRVSKLRHDFRNQVQAIELLWKLGEREKAAKCIDDLMAECRQESAR